MSWNVPTLGRTGSELSTTDTQQQRDPTTHEDWWVIAKLTIAS